MRCSSVCPPACRLRPREPGAVGRRAAAAVGDAERLRAGGLADTGPDGASELRGGGAVTDIATPRGSIEPPASRVGTLPVVELFHSIQGEGSRTGEPANGVAQVTVVANTAMDADALSTTCFVLGAEASRGLIEAHPDFGALFVLVDDAGLLKFEMMGVFAECFEPETDGLENEQ